MIWWTSASLRVLEADLFEVWDLYLLIYPPGFTFRRSNTRHLRGFSLTLPCWPDGLADVLMEIRYYHHFTSSPIKINKDIQVFPHIINKFHFLVNLRKISTSPQVIHFCPQVIKTSFLFLFFFYLLNRHLLSVSVLLCALRFCYHSIFFVVGARFFCLIAIYI